MVPFLHQGAKYYVACMYAFIEQNEELIAILKLHISGVWIFNGDYATPRS